MTRKARRNTQILAEPPITNRTNGAVGDVGKPATVAVTTSDFEERTGHFARVRALLIRIIDKQPGITYSQLGQQCLLTYGFLPRIGNRIREMRQLGWIHTQKQADDLLHIYPTKEEWSEKDRCLRCRVSGGS